MREVFSSQIVATLANAGVIVGLFFLVMEIRQADMIATATAEIEIRGLFSEVNEAFCAVPEFDELLVKAQDTNAELTKAENLRAFGFALRLENARLAIEVAYENDLLPPDTYSVIEDDMRAVVMKFPALAPSFRQIVDDFPSQGSRPVFIIMDKVLKERGH
jgi:hypothetical protein